MLAFSFSAICEVALTLIPLPGLVFATQLLFAVRALEDAAVRCHCRDVFTRFTRWVALF